MAQDRNYSRENTARHEPQANPTATPTKGSIEARLSEQHIRAMFDAMDEGVVLQDASSRILSSNPSAARLLGLTEEELTGRTSLDPRWRLVRADGTDLPPREQPSMQCLSTGKPVRNFVLGVDIPGGARRWLKISSVPIFEDRFTLPVQTVTTFSDITELKQQQILLDSALSDAKQAMIAKQEFLANISHELRTPLHGIIATATALGRSALDSRQRELVGIIDDSGQSLDSLVSNLLDMAKLDAGRLSIRESTFALEREIRSVVGLMQSAATEKGLELRTQIAFNRDARFVGDALRIRQILVNLISNAVKFTDTGSVTISANVIGSTTAGSLDEVTISVTDTGIGIAPDMVDRLFQRFEQADRSATRRYGGSGLGLAISKGISELLGGRIEVTSKLGEGSTFSLKISLRRAGVVAASEAANETGARPSGAQLSVLVAEDHPVNRKILDVLLEPIAHKVVSVADGEEALKVLSSERFELAILDVQMPKMDGISLAKAVRRSEASQGSVALPIIILSASDSEQNRNAVAQLGRASFLAKPLRTQALYDCIEELLSG
ncbi:MAG: ATP-binding protein [Alphaproteobacteria bacterium]|nr:ATP-binding protein [Alphaproteobacteria bacterium]